MKINQIKKIMAVILFAGTCVLSSLFAEDLFFSCDKTSAPAVAYGKYRCDDMGKIYYKSIYDLELDLFSVASPVDEDSALTLKKINVCRNLKDLFHNDFYSFDNQGNLFFVVTADFHKWQEFDDIKNVTFIYKFNPVDNSVSYFKINKKSTPNSFCLSDDGKWAFIDIMESVDEYREIYASRIYVISTDFNSAPKLIYHFEPISEMNHQIRNIVFSQKQKSLFVSALNNDLYVLKTDSTGNFSPADFCLYKKYKNTYMIQANNEGLFGITADSENPKISELVQLVDRNGNAVNVKENSVKKKIKGDWRFNPVVAVKQNCILFVSEDGSKIYKYHNKKIENVTSCLPAKANYNISDLETVFDILENKENESLEMKFYKRQILFFVIVLIIMFVIILVLLLWILHLNKKSNKIKKDKKFIFNIQEAERGKISRDVHDSIIQDLRAIRIESELLNVSTEQESRKNKIINTANDCVVKLRNICYNLTPAELATHSDGDSSKIELISIIQSLVLQFIERTHIPCQIKIDENFDYPILEKEISQNLFRIIQEALNNIEKHSYATNCQILIKKREEDGKKIMLIYISDDGIGCDVKQLIRKRSRTHFGVRNMMDRASLIGAEIKFQSEPGHGMEVRIKI